MHLLCFTFLKLGNLEIFFQKPDFYIWMKNKTDVANSNSPNGDNHEK